MNDLENCLVVGISSRALFDLIKEDAIFRKQGLEAYTRMQLKNEAKILAPGAGFALVQALLRLNSLVPASRQTEVVLMSRNNAETSLRIFNSIKSHGLDISRAALTSGASLVPYLKAYHVDLYLSACPDDVQAALTAGVASAVIYAPPKDFNPLQDQLRIAFDGDAVLFSEESELIYQRYGLDAFLAHEEKNAANPLPDGPFAKLLKTLAFLQGKLDIAPSPIRTALVTARNSPAHERVIRTLRIWGVQIDEVFFLGGLAKDKILSAFGAHMFFDDQHKNLAGSSLVVPCARVPRTC